MRALLPFLLLGAVHAGTPAANRVNIIRQQQQSTGVVWDMPVVAEQEAPATLMHASGNTMFQLWSIEKEGAMDRLIDQKVIGSYLPKADIKITTLDPYKPVARTRVDQPFTLDINIEGLLSGSGLPESATHVIIERHLASFPDDSMALDPAAVISGVPFKSAYISTNGSNILKFPASSLTAVDPTTACGEEHFVIHAISDGSLSHTQLASGFVQVWPIASGAIQGISKGDVFHGEAPEIELILTDLYPRSDTYLMLFEGTQITGVEGKTIKSFPMDRETTESHTLQVSDLDSSLTEDGTYSLALMSDTIYGRELLCEPITFSVQRGVNTDQVVSHLLD